VTLEGRDYYLDLRRRYEPTHIKLVVVAESPPASGLYFYDPTGITSEALFAAFMKLLGISPSTKEEGLREFQQCGWVLVDATYEPVNGLKKEADRNRVIERDYKLLVDDLDTLVPDRLAPLILIKKNVCELLEDKLIKDGFNVINHKNVVVFPFPGRNQKDFPQQFSEILEERRALQPKFF